MRKRLDHLDHALDQHVDPAAVVSGDPAEEEPQGEADRDADETHRERDSCAVEDAREHVAAEAVGAEEEELPVLRGTGEVEIAFPEPPEEIVVGMTEEAQRLHDTGI